MSQLPPVELPHGRDWFYFATMAMSAAFFGGIVLHYLRKYDPLGPIAGAVS